LRLLNARFSLRLALRNEIDHLALVRRVRRTSLRASMDILAGMLAYLAGIGALFGALALSLVLFTSTESKPPAPRQPQSATAMMVAPGASGKTPAAQARVKPAVEPQKHQRPAATPVEPARAATVAHDAQTHDAHRQSAMSAAKSRRLVHEERARRWAYQQDAKEPSQDPSFESRFLGYAD
jgi:hypothetical protein